MSTVKYVANEGLWRRLGNWTLGSKGRGEWERGNLSHAGTAIIK
jgi:hypothetical protein